MIIWIVLGESKNFTRLTGYRIKSMWAMFETKLLIYQSKAKLDEINLFGKVTHFEDSTIRQIPVRGLYKDRKLHVPL